MQGLPNSPFPFCNGLDGGRDEYLGEDAVTHILPAPPVVNIRFSSSKMFPAPAALNRLNPVFCDTEMFYSLGAAATLCAAFGRGVCHPRCSRRCPCPGARGAWKAPAPLGAIASWGGSCGGQERLEGLGWGWGLSPCWRAQLLTQGGVCGCQGTEGSHQQRNRAARVWSPQPA